jgi:acetyl esterase/lipase
MQMFVYLPAEPAGPATLPCVLVAPAGTILLTGNGVTDDYHKEALPYVEAGCVVVRYSLDGSVDDMDNPAQLEAGIQAFMKAEGGTVNGRNALEYVLQNLPQVNPRRIFVAGHSSAGTVALCMAAVEPRLAGCIAYAACADPEARLRDVLENNGPAYALLMQFLAAASPMKHASEIKCPVMVFHALDDSNVAYSEALNYVATLKSAAVETHFVTAASGDHYQPMIDEGIPAGIHWLQQQ